ncbi:MAG: molybdopterin-guanine dinucleotide biosynthesis protein B [Rhodospirillales bacterium]|nr:MAG: molybdopterin-guanine dinucleotide biosynthesis protein B [Rhodospirillales bacterium]
MKVFGIAGWSGSGKTTLMVRLLPRLIGLGLTVSTLKHTHERVDLDRPGKDTFRHREAGATDVMLVSASRWTLMHELRGRPEPPLAEMLRHMTPVDLVLVEGFKHLGHDKLEVHRPVLGMPLLCRGDPAIVAVASDLPLPDVAVPVLGLDDVEAIAAFVVAHLGLAPVRS